MTDTVDYARRELALRMRHAFGHDMGGAHHHLNLDAFMRELERFIDSKIAEANKCVKSPTSTTSTNVNRPRSR